MERFRFENDKVVIIMIILIILIILKPIFYFLSLTNSNDSFIKDENFEKFTVIYTYILDLINSDSFKNRGYFDSAIANKQYKKHLDGKIDISKEIWKWINLEVWFRKFID